MLSRTAKILEMAKMKAKQEEASKSSESSSESDVDDSDQDPNFIAPTDGSSTESETDESAFRYGNLEKYKGGIGRDLGCSGKNIPESYFEQPQLDFMSNTQDPQITPLEINSSKPPSSETPIVDTILLTNVETFGENHTPGYSESSPIDEYHLADSGTLPFTINQYLEARISTSNRSKRIWDKRDFCLYCYENVTNFSRHLMRKHNSEVAVQQFMKMKTGSVERKCFIDMLRKKGNFLAPTQKEIKLVKRPTKNVNPGNIVPCMYCKGYYMKRYLKRHVANCRQRPQEKSEDSFNAAEAQTYFAFRSIDDKFVSNLRLKEGVLKMRCDDISLIAKSDPLILSFASFYAKRHRHAHLDKVTKNKLRELARLWQNMKPLVKETSLFEALKPENFKYFVICTQNITGYNEKNQKFEKAPSLALHMGTTLKQLCEHAYSEIQQKNTIFVQGIDSTEKTKEVKTLRRIIKSNWNAEVSSVANQNIVENQWKKPTIIPLTSDIKKLNDFVRRKAESCVEVLNENEEDRKSFSDLQKCCYTLLITLNRRRVGELERLLLESYLQENNDIISEEFQQNLNETEKLLLKKYKRIRIRGKRHKPVPVLISKEVQGYIDLLLTVRKNFVPETNPYLFATIKKETCLDGYSALRYLVSASGVEHPQALTSGKLRKHIATISQIHNLDSSELEQLCTFLGHTMATHQNFYRLPQEIYQTAKLAKLLLKSQNHDINEELDSDINSDDDHTHPVGDENLQDGLASTEVANETTGQACESERQEPFSKREVITENGNIRKKRKTRTSPSESEGIASNKRCPKTATHDKNAAEKPNIKHPKIRWTPQQKAVTIKHFKENIKKKKPPTEAEIEAFRKKNTVMENKDWKKIKAFIFNEYKKL